MLPQALWILVLSLVSSTEARSSPQPRALSFSNVTSSNGANSTPPTSSLSSLASSVPRSTRTEVASEISSDTSHDSTSSTSLPSPSRTDIESSKSLANNTLPTASQCCFVIQDTVSEEWWQKTSYSSATSLVNLTSYTTYITRFPVTSTRVETNIYLTNASYTFTLTVGQNPITNLINKAPTPTEATQILTGSALVTAGVTIQSPQAIYVYNTVKIITVDALTDRQGNVFCATWSTGAHGDVFPRINENAQAYFGGPSIAGQTLIPTGTTTIINTFTFYDTSPTPWTTIETDTQTNELDSTAYTDYDGNIVSQTSTPTGVVISLVTPFIYAPPRGKYPAEDGCKQDSDTEAYGYIPYTLIDFLANDPHYNAQYPGIESCYGGGPSIIQVDRCRNPFESSAYQTAVEDLTSSTTIYIEAPSMNTDSTTVPTQPVTDLHGGASKLTLPTSDGAPLTASLASKTLPISLYTVPPPISALQENTGETSLGVIINSFAGNTPFPQKPGSPITIQSAITIPLSQAPEGAVGISTNIEGTPVLILTAGTTIPPPPPTQTPAPITISALTTITLSQTPPGASGSTTTINNTPYLIIQPTTITPIPSASLVNPFTTTLISGTPFVVVPPTTIPVSQAPAWIHGSTTVINNTPYLIVPSSTSLQVGLPQSQVLEAPFTTVVGGTIELIITGPTTIPINPLFPISGYTMVISGVTMVEVTAATTVVEVSATDSGSSSSSSSSSTGFTGGGSETSEGLVGTSSLGSGISRSVAARRVDRGVWWSLMGVVVVGVVVAAF